MTSEKPTEENLVLLGTYSPREASKLVQRFQDAGITFTATPRGPGYESAGPTITLQIRVDPARSAEVAQIHRELFGDGLPNYDSSFFRDQHNV
jgi:hypothetical protein